MYFHGLFNSILQSTIPNLFRKQSGSHKTIGLMTRKNHKNIPLHLRSGLAIPLHFSEADQQEEPLNRIYL